MKKIFLISALSLAMFGVMNAQTATTATTQTANKPAPEARAKKQVLVVNGVVSLNGEQMTKVNDLYVDYFSKLDATTDAAKSADLTKTANATLLTYLTPEQVKLWKASGK